MKLKFKYFSLMAENSFKTSPTGERLFYAGGGFWSRPYIIPDEETEKRLFRKMLWLCRIVLGAFVLGQPFIFIAVPGILAQPVSFLLYVFICTGLIGFVFWISFRKDLLDLRQVHAPVPLHDFFTDTAKQHSLLFIVLGFIACIAFVMIGLFIIIFSRIRGFQAMDGEFVCWLNIICFGVLAGMWGYIWYLKLTLSGNAKEVNNNSNKN